MKVARTGSYRPPRIEGVDAVLDVGRATTDSEGIDGGSLVKGTRGVLICSRVRETGEKELPRVVCDSVLALAKMAGRRLAENDDSSQRGSGWSVNGGGSMTRGYPEASEVWGIK
jgi:hypothetical protein